MEATFTLEIDGKKYSIDYTFTDSEKTPTLQLAILETMARVIINERMEEAYGISSI